MKKTFTLITILGILIGAICVSPAAAASTVPPDRAQIVLNLMTLECQSLNDYAILAQQGNTASYEAVRTHLYSTASNISLYLGAYDSATVNSFYDLYKNFSADAASASQTAQRCFQVREGVYQKMIADQKLLNVQQPAQSFQDCVNAGYYTRENTCFMGGNTVFDPAGNIIGIYNATCCDQAGCYDAECWYCEYGYDANGCLPPK